MLIDMGGKVYQMDLDYKKPERTPDIKKKKMKININDAEKLLGIELSEKKIKSLLERMGYDYKNKEVSIPAWRVDILHPVDIYEDIAIAYGYENFIPEIPEISTIGQEDKKQVLKNKIREILVGLNLIEISTFHLLSKQDLKKANQKQGLSVEKSKTDFKFLRNNLLGSMLKVLGKNVDSDYPQKLFEIGSVFVRDEKKETGINESEHLIVSLCPGNFTDIKQILDYLGNALSLEFVLDEMSHSCFIEGRTGKVKISKSGKEIGVIGEIHPTILKRWHIKMPLVLFEIDLEEIFKIKFGFSQD